MVPAMQRIIIQKQGDHIRSLTVQSKKDSEDSEALIVELRADLQRLKETTGQLQAQLDAKDAAPMDSMLGALEKENTELRQKLEVLADGDTAEQLEEIMAEVERLRPFEQSSTELHETIHKLEVEWQTAKAEAAQFQSRLESLEAENAAQQEAVQQKEETVQELTEQVEKLQSEAETNEQTISQQQTEIAQLRAQLQEDTDKAKSNEQSSTQHHNEVEQLRAQLQEYTDRAEINEQRSTQHRNEIEQLRAQLQNYTNTAEANESIVSEHHNEIEQLTTRLQEHTDKAEENGSIVGQQRNEIEQLKAQLHKAEENEPIIAQQRNEIEQLKAQLQEYTDKAEINEQRSTQHRNEIEQLRAQLQDYTNTAETNESIVGEHHNEIEQLRARLQEYTDKAEENEPIVGQQRNEIEQLKAQLQDYTDNTKKEKEEKDPLDALLINSDNIAICQQTLQLLHNNAGDEGLSALLCQTASASLSSIDVTVADTLINIITEGLQVLSEKRQPPIGGLEAVCRAQLQQANCLGSTSDFHTLNTVLLTLLRSLLTSESLLPDGAYEGESRLQGICTQYNISPEKIVECWENTCSVIMSVAIPQIDIYSTSSTIKDLTARIQLIEAERDSTLAAIAENTIATEEEEQADDDEPALSARVLGLIRTKERLKAINDRQTQELEQTKLQLTDLESRERDLAETGSDDDNAQEELQQRVVDLEDALTKKQEEFEQSQNTLSAMDAKIKTAEEKIAALQDSLLFAETQLREAKAEAATLSHSNSAAFQISVTAPSNDARSSSSDDSDKGYRTKELTDQLRDLEMDNKMLKNRLKEAQEAALSLQPNERKVRFPNDSDSSSSSSSGGERTSKSTLRRRIATLQRDLTTLQQQQQQQQGKQAHAADHSDNEHDALQGRIDELRNQLTQVEDQKLVQHQQQQQLQDRNASLEQRIHDLESQIHESSTSSTPPSSPPPPLVPQTEPPPTSPPSTHTARVIPATIIPSSPQQEEPEDEKEPQSQEPEQHEPHRPQQVDLTDSSSSSSDSSSDAEPESNTPAHIPPTSDNLSERSISIGSGDDEPAAQQRDNKLSPEHDIMAEDDNEPESAQTEEEDPEQARADQRARETNQYACEEWLLEQYIDELAAGNSCRISTVVLSRLTLEWECFSPKYLDPDCGNTWIRNIPIVLYNEAVKVKADDSETACQWLSVVIGLGTSYHRAFPTLDIQKKYLMPSWTATGLPGSPLTSKTNVLELTRPPATPCVDGLHAATNPQDRGLNGAVCIIEWFCRALQPTISVLYSKLMTPTLQHIDMYFNVVIVMPVIMAIQTKKPNPDVQVGEISSCCKKLSHLLRKYKVPDVLNRLVVSHLYKHIDIHFFNSVLNNHVEFSTMDSGFLLNMAVRQVDDEMRKYWPHIHPHPELVCSLAAGQTLMVPKEQWVGELSKLPDVQALLKHINSHQMHSLLSTYRAGRFEKAGIPEEFMKRLKVDMNAHPKERGTQQPEEHPAWDYDNVRAIEWPTPDEIDMQEQVTMDQQGFSDFINEILVDLPAPAALVEKSSTYQQLSVLFDTGIE